MYEKVDTNLDFVKREEQTIKFWQEHKVFEKTLDKTKSGKEFSFYDGPPTANGKPHIGHVLTRVVKDLIPRYKSMKGYHVLRKAGWDTHGLPVELEVEKQLKLDGKQDIEKYGIVPFIDKCKGSVFTYVEDWRKISDRLGYWVDMDNPYVTYHDSYIESVWWSLKTIFDRELIYKGHKIVPYCPRCGTALSSHEVAQGYKDVTEQTAVVKFKVSGKEKTYLLAWTTTPWTLPSNVALCMHPDHIYCMVELLESGSEGEKGERFIIAKELIGKHFEESSFKLLSHEQEDKERYKIIEEKAGKEWEGLSYEPLFDFYNVSKSLAVNPAKKVKENCYIVAVDNYVTLTDGTGIVHIAPAFGEDDARVGRKYNLPFVQLVNEAGRFVKGTDSLEGVFVKDADKPILADLQARGLLKQTLDVSHSYPFCWRCDTPLLYYARSTWFIAMTKLRDNLIKNNATINWIPETIGKGRMGNFLENVVDWGLSRERFWGTPLPIWVCECGHLHCVGSKDELKKLGGISGDIELHKPFVDEIVIKCDKCGKGMHRTPEVIDCWYDSGSMPFAQYHYPFENKDIFDKTFPADFISEAVDQTRGWFYTLSAISTLLFDKPAFKNCIVLGLVNDKNGQKMSKHKGNVTDPWLILNKQGADAIRWYFYTASALWLPSRFSEEAVLDGQRKFLGTLWNTYSFYVLYADIDSFDPTKYSLDKCKLSTMDKWLLSGLNTLIKNVDKNLSEFKILESARDISEFTDGLSNWYVRRCRERFWASGMEEDKIAAYMTLFTTLKNLSLVAAPFIPFMTESIYQNIVARVDKNAPESVHLCDFPVCEDKYIDKELEKGMELAFKAASLGRSARNATNLKIRQPLARMLVAGRDKPSLELLDILKGELNVKEIEFTSDAEDYIAFEVKPQLKTLGSRFGAKIGQVREHFSKNAGAVAQTVKSGVYNMELGGENFEIGSEDVLIAVINKEGFSAAADGGITVVLDTALTPALIQEGNMREIVSKIQNMRKDSGFEVTDHIVLSWFSEDAEIVEIFNTCGSAIAKDVLADKVIKENVGESININGKKVMLSVKKYNA